MPRISRRRFVVAATGPAVLALIAGGFLVAQGAKADNTIAVEVNAGSSLGTVPSTGLGINTGVYDGDLNNSAASAALSNAGVDALRYPGGSTSDAYDWQNNTTVSGQGYANPSNDFDDFMGIANKVGASPVITVNYGSGTAAEAAAWVKYADVTKNYGIKYWELGNEVYGDGTYGADWEYNTKSKGATAYADNIEDYITQMKAADSNIKVGAVLTAYGDWPDGLVAGSYGDSADWNETVLKTDGSKLDFVILHDYPASTGLAGMLAQYQNIANMVKQTRAEINEYAGSNAPNIQIMITETNSGYAVDSPTSALYAADTYMTFLQNGVSNVDWWDLHNGAGTIATDPDGTTDFNDSAILSSGNCTGSTCEPATDTPFPAYYGIKAVGDFATPGAEMLATTTSDSTVTAYAVQGSGGGVNLMLVNHSPDTSEPVSLAYNDFTAGAVTSAEQYTTSTKQLTTLTGVSADGLTLPAYSITVLKLTAGSAASATPSSGGGGELHAVGASKCLDVADFTTTPGTQLQTWDCNGGSNQQWTHTSSNQFTVYSGTSTMCLDAYNNQTTPGTKVQIWPCNGQTNQQWTLNSNGTITGVRSGLCLDVTGASTADGALTELWSCNGGSNQQWTLG
jgi:hypothetical protein